MTLKPKNKSIKESFYNFFENPDRDMFRKLILDNTGEHDDLDFKTEPTNEPTISKDILAMANKAGGALIFGVTENKLDNSFEPVGLTKPTDKTEFKTKIGHYLPDQLVYEVYDLQYQESEYPKLANKFFRIILIEYTPQYIPFLAKKDGGGIRKAEVYIRHNSSTIPSEFSHIQDIINRRLATGYSSARELSLQEHFDELKQIYSLISVGEWRNWQSDHYEAYFEALNDDDGSYFEANPKYPKENFEDFVVKMLELKKQIITSMVRDK